MATDPAGGSLISLVPIQDGTGEAEVRITLRLAASGGTYTEFLQATPDARTGGSGGGTYIAFEMQNPQFDNQHNCTANFMVWQSVAGVTMLLSAFQHGCRDGMTMRLAVHAGAALVWPDQSNPTELPVPTLGVGQPGIGAYGMPAGNAISQVQLGLIDRIAPAAVDSTKIRFTAFRNHAYVQWQAVNDDPNGSGLASYWIARDGLYFMRTTSTVFEDLTVNPSESHTYAIAAVDQHYNFSPAASVTVSTPAPATGTLRGLPRPARLPPAPQIARDRRRSPAPLQVSAGTPPADSGNGMDPRRVGVRALGSYWGAAGEQIDTTSGNLNFSIPLIRPLSRGGWGVTFSLSYNSQAWLQDSAGTTWKLGYDVGYGFGWMLQAGSIIPVWTSTSTIDHYLYVDATGAEYSLSNNNGGVWTGREGVYVTFDTTVSPNRLYFTDGSFWAMGSQSANSEPDGGTLYPTLIQDSNGNQIVIAYDLSNASSRMIRIDDPRRGSLGSYAFGYSSGHLSLINSVVNAQESYDFSYNTSPLNSPFLPSLSYGTIPYLQTVTLHGLGIAHSFQYDSTGTGEMTQMTTPLGGTLGWQYRTFTYGSGISLREVQSRTMSSLPSGGMSNTWSFAYDDVSSPTFHVSTTINDAGAGTSKTYYVSTQILYYQTATTLLPQAYAEFNRDGSEPLMMQYQWIEENGNVHKYTDTTMLDPNAAYAAQKTTYQYRDAYGNITSFHLFDYGHFTNPADWIYQLTYKTDTNYVSRYIRNRLTQSTVTRSGVNSTLVTNTYDPSTLTDRGGLSLHDSSYSASFLVRGNLSSSSPDGHSYDYDIGGVLTRSTDAAGRSVSTTVDPSTSYSLPTVLTPGYPSDESR